MTPAQLQNYVDLVENDKLGVTTGPEFKFEELIEAHTLMDENRAGGKIVVRGSEDT
ncbi:MAG: zinc-binding dehydrogenase [Steroidobacteraceae bacterium]